MKIRLATLGVLGVLVAGLSIPAATAAPNPNNQSGGAAGVVAAVVQVQDTLNNLTVDVLNGSNVEVVTVKDSLNNVLQNANFLNNITILRDFLNQPNCSVIAVCNSLNDVLNNNNVQISRLIAIDVLSGGDIVVFQQPLV